MPPISFKPGYNPILADTLPGRLKGMQPIVFNENSHSQKRLLARPAAHPNTDAFQSPVAVDANPEEKYRTLDWQHMAKRQFGDLENELGAGHGSSGFRGAKTSAHDTTARLGSSEVESTASTNSGDKTYPRTVGFTKVDYQPNSIEIATRQSFSYDRHDLVNLEDDVGIMVHYPKPTSSDVPRASENHPIVFLYRPSNCRGKIPPDLLTLSTMPIKEVIASSDAAGNVFLENELAGLINYDQTSHTVSNDTKLTINRDLDLNSPGNKHWSVAFSIHCPDDLYTPTSHVNTYLNTGRQRQVILLDDLHQIEFDIKTNPSGPKHLVDPVLLVKNTDANDYVASASPIEILTKDVKTGDRTNQNTVLSFKTDKWRVIIVTDGDRHHTLIRELDLKAMAAAAKKEKTKEALQPVLRIFAETKKRFAHKPISSIDRLGIDRKITDKKQIISRDPMEIGLNFNSQNWGTFCNQARTPDGAEVFFYFGKNGSACRYKATLDTKGKRITLTPKDHTEILPSLVINLESGLGSSLREINNRALTLIENLIFGPDVDFKVTIDSTIVVQTIFTGDQSGQFKNWAQTRPALETVSRQVVPGNKATDFVMETTAHDAQALVSGTVKPYSADNESLDALYKDYRAKAAQEASLVLPEVAEASGVKAGVAPVPALKAQITYPHTFKLKHMPVTEAFLKGLGEKGKAQTNLNNIRLYEDTENDIGVYVYTHKGQDRHIQFRYYRPSELKDKSYTEIMRTSGTIDCTRKGSSFEPNTTNVITDIRWPGYPNKTNEIQITLNHAINDEDLLYKNIFKTLNAQSIEGENYLPPHDSYVGALQLGKTEWQTFSVGYGEMCEGIAYRRAKPAQDGGGEAPARVQYAKINEDGSSREPYKDDPDYRVAPMTISSHAKKYTGQFISVKTNYHRVLVFISNTTLCVVTRKLRSADSSQDQANHGQHNEPEAPPPPPKPAPKITIPLSAADKKLLRDELRPAWMIAAASATPVKIESSPVKIDESAYLKFAPGEILTAGPDTLKWLKANCKVNDDGEEYLDLVPMRRLYWYELKSTSGNITLRLPVRYNPGRKKNQFVVDTSIAPEAYISFAKDQTTIKLTDDRFVVKNAKDGSIEFFMLDGSFEDERIKDFHFRTTTSPDSSIVMGAANVLDTNGQRLDEAVLRDDVRNALDVTTVAVLGHDVSDMPKVQFVNPRVTFKNEKDVTLTFVSPLENNRVEPIEAHLDGLNFDGDNLTSDTGELTLTFDAPEASGAPELEKIDVTLHPTATQNVFALVENGAGARLFLWNKSLGNIWEPSGIDLKTLSGNPAEIFRSLNFPTSPTETSRLTQGTRTRHTDNGSLVHIDERISYLPARLSSVPINYVVTENPDDSLIDDAVLNAHDKRYIPDEETFHVMLEGGRPREVATFVSPDDGSMLILPIETDPANKSWYRLIKQHKDAATFGAQLLLTNPKKPGEFILVPAKVYGDGSQIHVVTKTNAVLSLNMASTRANINKRRLSGFLSALPKVPTEFSSGDVRAALYEETEFYGLDESKSAPNLADNEFFVLGQEIILKDGRELNLTVAKNKDNGRLTFTGFIIDEENNREYIEYLNPNGTAGEMTVYRAQNGGALYYLDDGKVIYTLEIDDNGQPLILKRPQGIERFFTPKKAPRHIMINAEGRAYQSKAKSPATRREISEPGVWPRVFEIATDLGRSTGAGGNTLKGNIDSRDARVKIEIAVAKDGRWKINGAKIKTEGKDQNWQTAGFTWEPYGPDNKFLRLYIKGSEKRANRYFDFAWLDFESDGDLLGDNFGLRASYYNMSNSQRNAMPYDRQFGQTPNHEAMLWSAYIFSDAKGLSLMDRVIKVATDVGYFAANDKSPNDLVEYFMVDHPDEIRPALELAVSWLDRPKRRREKKAKPPEMAVSSSTAADPESDTTIPI